MRGYVTRIRKLIGAVVGGATGAGVAGVLALVGLDLPTQVDVALATILSWVGTYLAPPNADDNEPKGAHALHVNNPHLDEV